MEDKDGLDTTLTDLLEDGDLEKLEEIMEELLPIEGVKQAAAALAMSTGQGRHFLNIFRRSLNEVFVPMPLVF